MADFRHLTGETLTLVIPERCRLYGIYLRQGGWGAIVSADRSWPNRLAEALGRAGLDLGSTHEGVSSGSEGQASPQEAIDEAYRKMVLTIERLDNEKPWFSPKPDSSAVKKEADDLLKFLGI